MARAHLLALVCLGGCTDAPDAAPPPVVAPPAGCVPGEQALEGGGCLAAGVPPEACGQGFESDGVGGCFAILPPGPCAAGQMALPGENACRPVAPCGADPWGDIPLDGGTEHVSASYAGSDSDGSAARPWTTIGEALAAAQPGDVIAVGDGSYRGDVVVDKAVKLWGRCPERVEILGTGTVAALWVRATGAEVRGLAVSGGAPGGILVTATDVVVDGVWVHDTAWHGIHVEHYQGPASATIHGALIERAGAFGLYVYGAQVSAEDLAVRDTRPDAAGMFGYGVHVEDVQGVSRGTLHLAHALVERSSTIGIGNVGSDLTVDSTLVRDTLPALAAQDTGRGINAEDNPFSGAPATVAIQASVVELSRDMGIYLAGVSGSITHTVVRDTLPEAFSQEFGRALNVLADYANGVPSNITVKSSLFERSLDVGMAVFGSIVDAELVVIRQTALEQASQSYGNGVVAQQQIGIRAGVTLRSSVVEESQLFGALALGSDLALIDSRIHKTHARADGVYGDGVAVIALDGQPGAGFLGPGTLVADSDRAAVAAFGATVKIADTRLECNLIDLHSEPLDGIAGSFEDAGDNLCRCGDTERTCKASGTTLAPPEALPVE